MRFDDDEGSPPLPELVDVVDVDVVAGVVTERSAVPVPRLRICWGILRAPGVCGQFGTDWGSPEEDEEEGEFGEEEEADDEELAAATATATPTTANRRRRC